MKQSTKLLITGIVLFAVAWLFLDVPLESIKKIIGMFCVFSASLTLGIGLGKYINNE